MNKRIGSVQVWKGCAFNPALHLHQPFVSERKNKQTPAPRIPSLAPSQEKENSVCGGRG